MKRILLTGLFSFLACQLVHAEGGGGETSDTVLPTFTQNGNTWRVNATSPTNVLTLLSSAPAQAALQSSGTISLGISIYRERFVVNYCTSAALALYPTSTPFTQFSSTAAVILSSAPQGGTNWINISNSRYFYHQGNIFGVWDTGNGGGAVSSCVAGAVVMEEYYSGSADPTKRR